MAAKLSLSVVILAAGQGTRMRSALPKVLQPLGGRPLLAHVVETAQQLRPAAIHVVYGHGGGQVPEVLGHLPVNWVKQEPQLGTGHALQQVMPAISDEHVVLVLYGDVPLIQAGTLERLTLLAAEGELALLTAEPEDSSGYGRIVRGGAGRIQRIVEHKDADADQRRITEINTGLLAVKAGRLRGWLDKLRNDNAQGEYYLTDVIGMAVTDGVHVDGIPAEDYDEVHGINDRIQLAEAETIYRRRQTQRLLQDGVTLLDPERIDVRGELVCGQDVVIDVNVVFEGKVTLGDRVCIGPHSVIRDTQIGDDSEILSHTSIDGAIIGKRCRIGPFARIRPEARFADRVHVGNFVEVKKSDFAAGAKANHLAYVGDTTVGRDVNIGAGVITCNYDGANKHRTVIGDGAFIGSDAQLVAPVTIGANATIGAGSTITRDAPADELTLSRSKQTTITGWKRPVKKSKD